ncbi:MAG: PP2C family protein-serine/threonine phosphatase, partial [Paracoccus sp. (in: a-proteobacteria)]|nr:PP2C family protein-serine/threonine phosphatase [Paracoccus sp. (in: a-proteobacteria)]
LNHLMLADFRIDSYFTLVYGLADAVTGEVRLVQAGHPHPVILRRDGSTEKVGRGGMPVGLIENASYEETRLTLAPGDRLLVVSDGISEATDPAGVELGNRGLRNLMSEAAPLRGAGFLERLCRRVIERSGNRQDDDISALFLERGEG